MELIHAGYDIEIADNLVNSAVRRSAGWRKLRESHSFVEVDQCDAAGSRHCSLSIRISNRDSFAALKSVGESVLNTGVLNQ